MNKRMSALICVLLMLALSGCALAQGAAPAEVQAHIAQKWPGYELFDYIEVQGTPQGNYGFALLSSGREKLLVGYHEEDGEMRYWLKNAAAVPQGEGVSLAQWEKNPQALSGQSVFGLALIGEHGVKNIEWSSNRIIEYGDALGFTAYSWDTGVDEYRAYHQTVTYHWEEGGFKMSEYRNDDVWYGPVFVSEQRLDYYRGEWEYAGTAYGAFQRDLRYASLGAMPVTLSDAEEKLSIPPDIPTSGPSDLTAREVKFTGGEKYEVYTGPGKDYARSGNGKGSVSTNDWIQVFGEENGWIMIQYDISSDHFRIGYISAKALPKGADVNRLSWEGSCEAYAAQRAELTDDPLASRTTIGVIEQGELVVWLGSMGEWAYIETEAGDQRLRGFVRAEQISAKKNDFASAAKDLLTEVYGYSVQEAEQDFRYFFYEQGDEVYAVYYPKEHPLWQYSFRQNKETGELIDASTPFLTGYAGYPGEGTVRLELENSRFESADEVDAFFEKYYGPKDGWTQALEEWCEEVKRDNALR